MKVSPQYESPVIVHLGGSPSDQAVPLTRQRRRLEARLRELSNDDWGAPTRCGAWSVQDVVAHLVGVNRFWHASVVAGLAGKPTRLLVGFDPATTPSQMVDSMGLATPAEVLEMFVSTNDALLSVVSKLDDKDWMAIAESPAGHVSLRLVMQHGLWDAWIHERDILLPLGLTPGVETDEVRSCLQYAAAVSPALAIGMGQLLSGRFAVRATNPDSSFVLDVGTAVAISDGVADDGVADDGVPCLQGDAIELVEALSIRGPLPTSAPVEWRELLRGLAAAFDTVDTVD